MHHSCLNFPTLPSWVQSLCVFHSFFCSTFSCTSYCVRLQCVNIYITLFTDSYLLVKYNNVSFCFYLLFLWCCFFTYCCSLRVHVMTVWCVQSVVFIELFGTSVECSFQRGMSLTYWKYAVKKKSEFLLPNKRYILNVFTHCFTDVFCGDMSDKEVLNTMDDHI
jgi:hypothetical protein